MQFDQELFEEFFELLPRDTEAAAKLAHRHDQRVSGRSYMQTNRKRPIRHAIEIRSESFRSPEFIRLLRRHKIAPVIADTAGRWPLMEDITADFVYIRLHGDKQIYVSGYTPKALDRWAARIHHWQRGGEPTDARKALITRPNRRKHREIYAYFDNDVKVRAPYDAMNLAKRLA
jgi:uncharacterized protein YecE (DUF72 family)